MTGTSRLPFAGARDYAQAMADPTQRASDAEREETADRLRVAAGDGRLDPDELEERLEAAYRARTVGELTTVTADLPATPAGGAAPEPAWRSEEVRAKLATFIVANTICILIWALTGADGSFWPKWVLFGTGVALFATLVHRVLGVDEEHRPLEPPRAPEPPRPPELPGPRSLRR